MLLRMSSQTHGMTVDLAEVVDTHRTREQDADCGVPGGAALRGFALALVSRRNVNDARARLIAELGPDAVAAAAGIVGAFEAVNRVADATGTKLDDMMASALKGPLAGLGIESLSHEMSP
jgi:hypothetical protein